MPQLPVVRRPPSEEAAALRGGSSVRGSQRNLCEVCCGSVSARGSDDVPNLDHRPVADPGVHTERERDCFSRQLLARGSVKEALARLARGDRIDGILPV